jgi:hypothetical protein
MVLVFMQFGPPIQNPKRPSIEYPLCTRFVAAHPCPEARPSTTCAWTPSERLWPSSPDGLELHVRGLSSPSHPSQLRAKSWFTRRREVPVVINDPLCTLFEGNRTEVDQ